MTIASRTTAVTLIGNGSNRKFSFTFRAWEGEIRVMVTDPEDQATDVTAASTIALAANSLGGIVTYPAATGSPALKAGWKLTIMRDMDFLQEVALVNATRWNPEVIEQEFDRLTAMCQQLREMADRAPSVTAGAEVSAAELLEDIYNVEQRIREIAGQAEDLAATLPDIAAATAGDTMVVETGPGGGLVARWQPPSAGAPPQRTDTELVSPLAAGAVFTVPQYTVGGKKLTVHLDGVLCAAGATGFYLEVGAAGSKSTTITLNNALAAGRELTAIVAG